MLDQARDDLQIIGGLPEPSVVDDIWSDIWKDETHHSTAMEGNTLRRRQVQLLLDDGIVTGSSKELREWLEVQDYAEAARWVYQHAVQSGYERPDVLVTEPDIRRIHVLVVSTAWQHFPPEGLARGESPGAYRTRDLDQLRAGFYPRPVAAVASELERWLERANQAPTDDSRHLFEELAYLHAAFERIHPFPDGNGRVGRLVLNLLLVRYGHPPAVIHKDERPKYLRALERADEGDEGTLAELIARAVRDGIHRFLMPALAGPLSVVPLPALATADLSRTALLAAAQRGRLRANKYGGVWYSTQKWVEEYKASRHRRAAPSLAQEAEEVARDESDGRERRAVAADMDAAASDWPE